MVKIKIIQLGCKNQKCLDFFIVAFFNPATTSFDFIEKKRFYYPKLDQVLNSHLNVFLKLNIEALVREKIF